MLDKSFFPGARVHLHHANYQAQRMPRGSIRKRLFTHSLSDGDGLRWTVRCVSWSGSRVPVWEVCSFNYLPIRP